MRPAILKNFRVASNVCPYCGELQDGAMKVFGDGGGGPKPGSLSICAKCAKTSEWVTDGLLLRRVAFDKTTLGPETLREVEILESAMRTKRVNSITCPKCGRVSYNIGDIQNRYCGNCHQFHDDMQ